MFGTAGRAFDLLEREGVATLELLQLVIDKPDFRSQIVKAWQQANPTVLQGIPDEPQNLKRFLMQLFRIRIRTEDEITKNLNDWPERLQEVLEENRQNIAELDRLNEFYGVHEHFAGLFDCLDERSISVIVTSMGLEDGEAKTMKFTGEAHGISGQRAADIQNKALLRIQRKLDEAARQERLAPDNVLNAPIEDLDLSERARNPLRRSRIDTIGDLIGKTEDDLLYITNFGEVSLAEVKAKLAELELSLKQ